MEEKVKILEGEVEALHSTIQSTGDFTFNIGTSQALLDQTSYNEWVVNYSCTHHMDKDDSLFSSLDTSIERNIYMADDFSLHTVGYGDVTC